MSTTIAKQEALLKEIRDLLLNSAQRDHQDKKVELFARQLAVQEEILVLLKKLAVK